MRAPFARERDGSLRLRLPAEGIVLLEGLLHDLNERIDDTGAPPQRRLFPRAYADDAEESRFRELTHGFLVAAKHGAVEVVLEMLSRGEAKRGTFEVSMNDDESNALLGAVNDLRLVIGTILEVTDDDQPARFLPPDDPRALHVNAYLWLGAVQEALLAVLLDERGTAGSD